MPAATATDVTSADPAPARQQRATALPPDERRAAIVAATLPLVLEHGEAVSTRQIAIAAGIAEGTIFRVFADKESLLAAVVDAALDPAATESALREVDRALPFEERLAIAIGIVQQRLTRIWRLTWAIGKANMPQRPGPPTDMAELVDLFAEEDNLAYEPVMAARMLRAVTLATSHPALIGDDPMSPEQIVDLLLHGIVAH